VILLGHSYGSTLAVLVAARRPDLVQAYVGLGQVACDIKQQSKLQDAWLIQQATSHGDAQTLALAESGKPYDRESALFEYGGEIVKATNFFYLVEIGLRSPEYSFLDAYHVKVGVDFTHAHLRNDVYAGSLMDAVPKLEAPVYFFEGRRDYTAPVACVQRYLAHLTAPHKELVWFNASAHFPFLEEPNKFAAELRRVAASTTAQSH
jgi:pimeloyl-ACP methyl ester carboxylesterase